MSETYYAAARRLADEPLAKGFVFETLFTYRDAEGGILHWRIRLKHPETGEKWIRPMMFDGERYVLREPEYTDGKPLYGLRELAAEPASQLFVVEGEACVDVLADRGVLATTSGGATSAEAADWRSVAGRSVTIWPDTDLPGAGYAHAVIAKLAGLECEIRVVDVAALALPDHGDVVDWLAVNPDATAEDLANLPTLTVEEFLKRQPLPEETDDAETDDVETDDEGKKRQSQASVLVAFVQERVELFHDLNSEVYAQDIETRETRRLEGRFFRDWLVASFYEATAKSARDQSVREAISTLAGLGRFKGDCREVFVRVAMYEGAYYLDLAEPGLSRAVRIEAGRWVIEDDPPVRFVRSETARPLPEPVRGGDLTRLWRIVNVGKDQRLLVLAWLAECLRPDTPFPILELMGEQGSAKSTAQEALRRLIDPNSCNLRSAPKSVEDVFVGAGVNWLVSYENISHLSAPMQDALCVLATGGGFAKRKLYSDDSESVIQVKRPVVLNGISAAVTAQDLVDRTLSVETPVIAERVEVTVLWKAYDAEHGRLLGAFLDLFAKALELLPSVVLPAADRPRLTEFARLGIAVARALGRPGSDFLKQFNACREEAIARTIDASPVAVALVEWFEAQGCQTAVMPVKGLLTAVTAFRPAGTDAWPRSPKGFGDALRRAAPALRQIGIECRSLGKTGSYVSWEVRSREGLVEASLASLDVVPSEPTDQDITTCTTSTPEDSSPENMIVEVEI